MESEGVIAFSLSIFAAMKFLNKSILYNFECERWEDACTRNIVF